MDVNRLFKETMDNMYGGEEEIINQSEFILNKIQAINEKKKYKYQEIIDLSNVNVKEVPYCGAIKIFKFMIKFGNNSYDNFIKNKNYINIFEESKPLLYSKIDPLKETRFKQANWKNCFSNKTASCKNFNLLEVIKWLKVSSKISSFL